MPIEEIKIKALGEIVSAYPIATKAVELIKGDAANGVLQTEQGLHSYWNSEYIDYKSNWMFPRQESNRTSSVDMILTGDLMRSLYVKDVTNDNTQSLIEYGDSMAEEKISFNDGFGRYITTLNSNNIENIETDIKVKLQEYFQELADLEITDTIEV